VGFGILGQVSGVYEDGFKETPER